MFEVIIPVIITNTGNQPIHGITVNVINPPAGLTGVSVTYQGANDSNNGVVANNYAFSIIITGTPPAAGTYDYSGFSCTITPN